MASGHDHTRKDTGKDDSASLASAGSHDETAAREESPNDNHQQNTDDASRTQTPEQSGQNDDGDDGRHSQNSQGIAQDDQEDFGTQEEETASDPQQFDSRSFLFSVNDLSAKLQADQLKHVDNDFPAEDLKSMVRSVTSVMNNFRGYAMHSQSQLENVREQMKEIKDRIYKRIQTKGYDPKSVHEKKSAEERELDAKLAQLNKEIAKAAEELIRASQLSLETETAATEASLVAEQAAEEARRIQAEYETRRKAEMEARKAEEERREAQRKRREEEERKQEEIRKAEEARATRLTKPEDAKKQAEWETWPTFTYNVRANDYNQEIGCIVRGDPSNFKENMVAVDTLNPLGMTTLLGENEELVGDVLDFRPAHGDETLQSSIYVAIPHCTSRASAISREAVIKAETSPDMWEELRGHDVPIDGYKELKFVQAEVKSFSKLCVVSRYKRNYLHFTKKGGKVSAPVDPRVTFIAEKNTFRKPENFVLQLQPVDSATIGRVKERADDGKNLLTSSSVVSLEWTSKSFEHPVTMTLPCPPNPVKAKKAASARAAKEAKMKNPGPPPSYGDDEEPRRRDKKRNTKAAKQGSGQDEEGGGGAKTGTSIRFYMGQYGDNEDDENDSLFFLKKTTNGKWQAMEHMAIVQAKLDLLQFSLTEPIAKFMVIRTKTSVDVKMSQGLAHTIEDSLKERVVGVILRQKTNDPCDVLLSVVPSGKVDKATQALDDEGYQGDNNNQQSSKEVPIRTLNEGDTLEVAFRGNVKSQSSENLEFIFNSQLPSQLTFSISEVDKYLQRSFRTFRGFVQLMKVTRTVRMPTKKDKKEEGDGEAQPKIEIKKQLISEHMVNIPKEEENGPQTIIKAPVVIKNESHCLDDETLKHISQSLGDEWTRVAHHLNVRRQRIQAILRNNPAGEEEDAKFDMLLTWLKKVPRSQNKVDILISALSNSSRLDLADELRVIEREFQAQRRSGCSPPRSASDDRHSVRSGSARSVRA